MCLKNHSSNLHASIYGIFCLHSVDVARVIDKLLQVSISLKSNLPEFLFLLAHPQIFFNWFVESGVDSRCKSFCAGFLRKNRKRRGYSKLEFCDFVLWNSDCNLASSFSSKVVLSGRMERLAQRNKIKLRITPSFLNPSGKLVTLSTTVTSVYPQIQNCMLKNNQFFQKIYLRMSLKMI